MTIKMETADNLPSNQLIAVKASGAWTLSLEYPEESLSSDYTRWAHFGKYADVDSFTVNGFGSDLRVQFNWMGNRNTLKREVTVKLTCGPTVKRFKFTQNGTNKSAEVASVLESDNIGPWMEIPALNTPGLYYFTHPMTTADGRTNRNFSFGWDPERLVALWVAYPLNYKLIGGGSRTDEWGLDPKLPRKYQPVLFSPYRGGYDRGHQCPSADRLSYNANVETFYGTNMTPQMNSLNAAAWGVLEGMVRKWANQFDTLYVVTGCTVTGQTGRVYDNDGKAVTVPSGYYKVLLGYRDPAKGSIADSGSNGGYAGIGFWFDHKAYSGSVNVAMNQAATIDDIEERTGLDFFTNLYLKNPTASDRVESTFSRWWSQNI